RSAGVRAAPPTPRRPSKVGRSAHSGEPSGESAPLEELLQPFVELHAGLEPDLRGGALGRARRRGDRVRGPRAARRRAEEAPRVARTRLMVHRNVPIALPSTGDEEWEALREPLQS